MKTIFQTRPPCNYWADLQLSHKWWRFTPPHKNPVALWRFVWRSNITAGVQLWNYIDRFPSRFSMQQAARSIVDVVIVHTIHTEKFRVLIYISW